MSPGDAAAPAFVILRQNGSQVNASDADVQWQTGIDVDGTLESRAIITNPAAGTWTMKLTGAASSVAVPYRMQADVADAISVTGATDGGHYHTGATISLSAHVEANATGYAGGFVNATVTKPDDTATTVPLADVGNGDYSAAFSDTAACGWYSIQIDAEGFAGTFFNRRDTVVASVGVSGNAVSDPCNDDNDGDGLTDNAELGVYHTDPMSADTDGDHCLDSKESQFTLNPLNPWDFYSVPVPALVVASSPAGVLPNNVVSASDAQAVFVYFKNGAVAGSQVYQQDLNLNGVPDGIEYDRTLTGPLRSGAPDGVVSAADAQLAFAQFKAGFAC
jgi:hypothetical protein